MLLGYCLYDLTKENGSLWKHTTRWRNNYSILSTNVYHSVQVSVVRSSKNSPTLLAFLAEFYAKRYVMLQRTVPVTNYLDDFLFIALLKRVCNMLMRNFKEICDAIKCSYLRRKNWMGDRLHNIFRHATQWKIPHNFNTNEQATQSIGTH